MTTLGIGEGRSVAVALLALLSGACSGDGGSGGAAGGTASVGGAGSGGASSGGSGANGGGALGSGAAGSGSAAQAGAAGSGGSGAQAGAAGSGGAPLDLGTERYLHADGTLLRDATGAEIALRGVNLGGWLVTENWMCGITDATDAASGRFTLETLEARFGAARADELMGIWRDGFLTTADLDDVKELGFNVVRVPFGWRNLQHADGSWRRDARGDIDFSRLDYIVRAAAARGIYVLFDYHVWKGQERGRTSDGGDAGQALAKEAYEYITCGPDDGRRQAERAHAVEVWTAVIEHYRGNGHVAAFELINESCGGTWGSVFLYDALREVDPDRLFLIWGDPMEQTRDWQNVIYGPHQYDVRGASLAEDQATIDADLARWGGYQVDYGVPYFVGEFHVFSADAMPSFRYLLQGYAARDFGWAKWTYKAVGVGDWSLVSLDGAYGVDVSVDSDTTIAERWGALRTATATPRTELRAVLAEGAGL